MNLRRDYHTPPMCNEFDLHFKILVSLFTASDAKLRRESFQQGSTHKARLTKSNPKHFWKYIKFKSSRNINVGELKSIDANRKEIWIAEDQDKANELAMFYSNIFTIEVDEGPIVSLQTATVCDDIDLT